jgi:hypothetical protein
MTKLKTALVVLALLAATSVAWAQCRHTSCYQSGTAIYCQCY